MIRAAPGDSSRFSRRVCGGRRQKGKRARGEVPRSVIRDMTEIEIRNDYDAVGSERSGEIILRGNRGIATSNRRESIRSYFRRIDKTRTLAGSCRIEYLVKFVRSV